MHSSAAVCSAQVNWAFTATAEVSDDGQPKQSAAFTLPTQASEMKEPLEEFDRMVKHEQWEKAFKSLDVIAGKATTGYIDRGDGVWVPSRLLVRRLLATLPAGGKTAYRLFYDSQATALLEKATGRNESTNLAAIVANNLISSVGDRAADRLGDLHFEQGEMEQAVAAWRSLVDFLPDSKIPKAQTLAKIATALARSGRWGEFDEIARQLRERHAADSVELGGRSVKVTDYLASMATASQAKPAESRIQLPDDLVLPNSVEPSWYFKFQSREDANNPSPFALFDVYGRQRPNDFVIPAAVSDKRVHVNVFGVEMAFDLANGKLLWRTGKLHTLQFSQGRQGTPPERFSLVLSGDRTYSVLRDAQQQQNQSNQVTGFGLVAREAATGKEIFNTRKTLNAWAILGQPYPVGDSIYIGGSRASTARELAVLVLSKDGKLSKSIAVGNYAIDQNQVYGERICEPSFLAHRDRLYVDTHAGALVSIEPQTGTIDWGMSYDSPGPQTGYNNYNTLPPRMSTAGPIYVGGLLFAKGMRSSRLLGIETIGPTLVWKRAIDAQSTVVGADDERLYVCADELSAYSLKTQELLWATPLPRSAPWSMPLITKTRLYQFTSRGICEVDKSNGDVVRIFRGTDLDSYGGTMHVTPTHLVTVSNLGITAYPLNAAEQQAQAAEQPGGSSAPAAAASTPNN